jgi:hypothetical protein
MDQIHQKGGSGPRFTKLVELLKGCSTKLKFHGVREITHYRGVGTAASIVIRVGVRVGFSGGSGGLKNTRIIEMMQPFILVWANRCPMSRS